ncbi:MAG TPA: hypothetical protein VLI54_01145 [Bacillota bacterium]|nr:hypothetical protein [Bacillota bacterium]
MFRKAPQDNPGMEIFSRCANKTVATPTPKKARLDCAVTGPEGFAVSVERARDSGRLLSLIAEGAGSALCRECRFPELSREEVSALRSREALAEMERVQAERDLALCRIEVQTELQRATTEALETSVQQAIESPSGTSPV